MAAHEEKATSGRTSASSVESLSSCSCSMFPRLVGRGSGSSAAVSRSGYVGLIPELLERNSAEPWVVDAARSRLGGRRGATHDIWCRIGQPFEGLQVVSEPRPPKSWR